MSSPRFTTSSWVWVSDVAIRYCFSSNSLPDCSQEVYKVLDTLFVLFAALVSKDPSSLIELESQASGSPEVKGKGKGPLDKLSGILFSLLESASSSDFDPLVLVAPEGTYTDAELRRAGLGKKEKVTVRNIQLALFVGIHRLNQLVADGVNTFHYQEEVRDLPG